MTCLACRLQNKFLEINLLDMPTTRIFQIQIGPLNANIYQIYCVMFFHQYLDTEQVQSLSNE